MNRADFAKIFEMNAELKEAFARIKPACDIVMVRPSPDTIAGFLSSVSELKKDLLRELQQYILFPLITHLKSTEIENMFELQSQLVDAMRMILEKVTVNNFEMCIQIQSSVLNLVFDNSKPGMIAEVPEELMLSVMRCLTVLMLNLDNCFRIQFLKTQVPMVAQAVFVSVHIAKLEKLRILRIAAVNCVMAHTATHPKFTNDKYQIMESALEAAVVEMLSSILPGLLAALQDIATCVDNPGHAVIVKSLEAIHRILCIAMNDKYLKKKSCVTTEDFAKMYIEKAKPKREVSGKDKSTKDVQKRTPEWFSMAGDKLTLITTSVVVLRTHEHFKVRKELAVFCSRLLFECSSTMQQSIPLALDVLITLSKDEYPQVSEYCMKAIDDYFRTAPLYIKHKTMDSLCENLFTALISLPRVLNNIDSNRKLSSLNLLHGYLSVLSEEIRPQRLSCALSARGHMDSLCLTLVQAAALYTDLTLLTLRTLQDTHSHATDVTSPPPTTAPWCKLRHLDTVECETRLTEICLLLGNLESTELIVDHLLEMFQHTRDPEIVYIINWIGSANNSLPNLVKRIIDTYIEENVWNSPLELDNGEPPISKDETLDLTVYNPRAWTKDSVPGLYEGATETRYTDISYQVPRVPKPKDPNTCATLAEAQKNMVLSCLLTEGLGIMARRLMMRYQPYLLRTLCLLLERVGSKYELLHLSGLKAIHDVAAACGHTDVGELINCNADYFTNQITRKLKKAWDTESALQILSVVMEYSDASILDCLYGIVQDVLLQSCDKFHDRKLYAYLQVFQTFINCIRRWFSIYDYNLHTKSKRQKEDTQVDTLGELKGHMTEEEESKIDEEVNERDSGKTAEEMYWEDVKEREENILNYDDKVTEETSPLPHHIVVCMSVLKRCLHFTSSPRRDEAILALRVLKLGLPVLQDFEDELLPLVHLSWAPLVARFQSKEPAVLMAAFELFVTMAALSKDFIRSRALKEVLPTVYKFLNKSATESYLKDIGSAYRNSNSYNLQVAVLTALPDLIIDLGLDADILEEPMTCVDHYLSNKQPKPLQNLAVDFYKAMLCYDRETATRRLHALCTPLSTAPITPTNSAPTTPVTVITPTTQSPSTDDKHVQNNVNAIFDSKSN